MNASSKDPPPAWMPRKINFEAEFCGSDYNNYIYIKPVDPGSLQNYKNLRCAMDKQYTMQTGRSLPEDEIVPNVYVVLKEGSSFHRVRISLKDEHSLVHCVKIDDGICTMGSIRQFFPMREEFQNIPCTTIKCRLNGLDIFDGLPHLELGYRLIKMAEISDRPFYDVEVLGFMKEVPYVDMTRDGMSLKTDIQKFIPTLCEPLKPKVEAPFRGEVLHVNHKASIWFRRCNDGGLNSKIAESLQHYKKIEKAKRIRNAYLDVDNSGRSTPESVAKYASSSSTSVSPEPQKKQLLELPGAIFVTELDEELFRVRILRRLPRNQVEVEYMDFGNQDIICNKKLIPVSKIDENLGLIPSQCLRARLAGFYRINSLYFWKLMPSQDKPTVNIVFKDNKGDEENGIEVDIFRLDSKTSISEEWKTSGAKKLMFCSFKPMENSTGAGSQNENRHVSQPRLTKGVLKWDHIQLLLSNLHLAGLGK